MSKKVDKSEMTLENGHKTIEKRSTKVAEWLPGLEEKFPERKGRKYSSAKEIEVEFGSEND